MKTLLTIFLLSLPCSALAGELTPAQWDKIDQQIEEAIDRATANPPWKSPSQGQIRIVKCTGGLAAVQESYEAPYECDRIGCLVAHTGTTTKWRTLPGGCVPIEAAKRMYAEEIAWRNRPSAPSVIEPVEVIEP